MDGIGSKREQPVILAVDDDEVLTTIVAELFRNDATVITAKNTTEALPLMRQYRPDIMLLDDMMPGGITGLSFLEFLRTDPELSTVPVIMLTASNKPDEVVRGLNAGAVDYITKPVKPANLAASVMSRLLKSRHRIFIVESDREFAESLRERFQKMECLVTLCANGDEILTKAASDKPTLVIADWHAQGVYGEAFIRELRGAGDQTKLPLVLVAEDEDEEDTLRDRIRDRVTVVSRPCTPDEVLVAAARLLRG